MPGSLLREYWISHIAIWLIFLVDFSYWLSELTSVCDVKIISLTTISKDCSSMDLWCKTVGWSVVSQSVNESISQEVSEPVRHNFTCDWFGETKRALQYTVWCVLTFLLLSTSLNRPFTSDNLRSYKKEFHYYSVVIKDFITNLTADYLALVLLQHPPKTKCVINRHW